MIAVCALTAMIAVGVYMLLHRKRQPLRIAVAVAVFIVPVALITAFVGVVGDPASVGSETVEFGDNDRLQPRQLAYPSLGGFEIVDF